MNPILKNGVVIAAGGESRRMGTGKIWRLLGDRPVLEWVLRLFLGNREISRVIISIHKGDEERFEALKAKLNAGERLTYVLGGQERQDSVYSALQSFAEQPPSRVLIHDGARPLCDKDLLSRVLLALKNHPVVLPILPVHDTVRRQTEGGSWQLVARNSLIKTQTPQGFWWDTIWQVHCLSKKKRLCYTDDAEMVIQAGHQVHMEMGLAENIKLTTEDDFEFAKRVLSWGNRDYEANVIKNT